MNILKSQNAIIEDKVGVSLHIICLVISLCGVREGIRDPNIRYKQWLVEVNKKREEKNNTNWVVGISVITFRKTYTTATTILLFYREVINLLEAKYERPKSRQYQKRPINSRACTPLLKTKISNM